MRRTRAAVLVVALAAAAGCSAFDPDPAPALPPNTFAFGVFGDGPYYPWENGRWQRVLADVGRTDVAWLLHIGDLYWYPCSDEHIAERGRELNGLPRPVIYTPGDNEWTDCHDPRAGGYQPLERLTAIRRMLFAAPSRSLGAAPMELETQSSDPAFAEFVENARWRRGGFVFATVHVVGSGNGAEPFEGRPAASDAEPPRRMSAAIAWMDQTFDTARTTGAKGVVLAFHGELGLALPEGIHTGYGSFVEALQRQAAAFPGPILLIHGDSHRFKVDHPLVDSAGRAYANVTRLETLGSPDIGWIRVVVDTVQGRVTEFEPRRMRGWW